MKRLVICCDGTWNKPDAAHVSNIEKIARTVQIDSSECDGVQQLVLYLSGVGVGYGVDRILGGAFGLGLFNNVRSAYRFLASNYEDGDEIYVFGFSRGAYTARSLCGMIGAVGLLTRRALVQDKLVEAVARYRRTDPPGGKNGQSDDEFKRDHCHAETPITFLGVFDTVGALGVPGLGRHRYQFHNLTLGDSVLCARHALAIDEPRMKFEPSLWEAVVDKDGVHREDPRVRQVWFEGAHSDIGGGADPAGLPHTALLWMASEAAAKERGLVFDEDLLREYVGSQSSAVRHNPLKWHYRVLNVAIRTRILLARFLRRGASGAVFLGGQRRLDRQDGVSVRVASAAAEHCRESEDYCPPNLKHYRESTDDFTDCVEDTIALPEPSYDDVVARLAARGIFLGARGRSDGAAVPAAASPAGTSSPPPVTTGQSIPASRRPATESEIVT